MIQLHKHRDSQLYSLFFPALPPHLPGDACRRRDDLAWVIQCIHWNLIIHAADSDVASRGHQVTQMKCSWLGSILPSLVPPWRWQAERSTHQTWLCDTLATDIQPAEPEKDYAVIAFCYNSPGSLRGGLLGLKIHVVSFLTKLKVIVTETNPKWDLH